MILRIADWAEHYENNRTKDIKVLSWFKCPIRLGGNGYAELVDHIHGESHFGIFIALAEYAANLSVRGTFADAKGMPYTPNSLARTVRMKRIGDGSYSALY